MEPTRAPVTDQAARAANHLAGQTSPYLLQHVYNPVDWYPWGPEALDQARSRDVPIFLSIGYSACHWCHVMERECFEDRDIARLMNEHFVNIKVDREERPDLDQIYMNAVQAMTGHGGWPMSVFLTPGLEPFFGGTYFPPVDSRGMAGFPRVLSSVHRAWQERRDEITGSAALMTQRLREMNELSGVKDELPAIGHLDEAARVLLRNFDPLHGGFGKAPKFPHPMDLKVLLRRYARTGDEQAFRAVAHTLEKMARGGIYDHLGGGFARYSTDDRWLVPHFEKMLYDNALLAGVYLEAFQVTSDPRFARVARETLDYLLGRMTGDEGAFFSTEDADSEGHEGKYYVWSQAEIHTILGADRGKTFCYVYDVTEGGNWEGQNILNLPRPLDQAARLLARKATELDAELTEDRRKLLSARELRVPPGKDTKVLVSWNGLAIAALAAAGRVLQDPRYLDAACHASRFILERMRGQDGRLLHTYKDGQARLNAYLDDYANFADGLTRLFEATGEVRWIDAALELCQLMITEFADSERGGFYYTGKSHESLITRPKDVFDNATPSGNAMAATALSRLAALSGRTDLKEAAEGAVRAAGAVVEKAPTAAGQSLIALDFLLASTQEIAVVSGADSQEFDQALDAIFGQFFLPHAVIAPASAAQAKELADRLPVLKDRGPRDGRLTVYVCEGQTCQAPAVGVAEGIAALKALQRGFGHPTPPASTS